MRANQVGLNLDLFDSFGDKRKQSRLPPLPHIPPPDVFCAARQLERLIPRSSLWPSVRRIIGGRS